MNKTRESRNKSVGDPGSSNRPASYDSARSIMYLCGMAETRIVPGKGAMERLTRPDTRLEMSSNMVAENWDERRGWVRVLWASASRYQTLSMAKP